jgi:hypothetical protein
MLLHWKGYRKETWGPSKALAWNLPGETEEGHDISVRIVIFLAEFQIRHLLSTSQMLLV